MAKREKSVRIIAGEWRGTRIAIPIGTMVRPTPDRARETLFNWLSPAIVGARCLDLFAGTGVLGLEALSRGAKEVWFVETEASLISALRKRIADLDADATVIREDVAGFLKGPAKEPFDVVFLDPPYDLSLEPILAQLSPWLAPRARIYVERPQTQGAGESLEQAGAVLSGAALVKESRAGQVCYGLLALEE